MSAGEADLSSTTSCAVASKAIVHYPAEEMLLLLWQITVCGGRRKSGSAGALIRNTALSLVDVFKRKSEAASERKGPHSAEIPNSLLSSQYPRHKAQFRGVCLFSAVVLSSHSHCWTSRQCYSIAAIAVTSYHLHMAHASIRNPHLVKFVYYLLKLEYLLPTTQLPLR